MMFAEFRLFAVWHLARDAGKLSGMCAGP